jgi:hypothetical protein
VQPTKVASRSWRARIRSHNRPVSAQAATIRRAHRCEPGKRL